MNLSTSPSVSARHLRLERGHPLRREERIEHAPVLGVLGPVEIDRRERPLAAHRRALRARPQHIGAAGHLDHVLHPRQRDGAVGPAVHRTLRHHLRVGALRIGQAEQPQLLGTEDLRGVDAGHDRLLFCALTNTRKLPRTRAWIMFAPSRRRAIVSIQPRSKITPRTALGAAARVLLACAIGCGGVDPAAVPTDHVVVRVRAQDTAWSGDYVLPRQPHPLEVPTGRQVHVPLGAEVELRLESRDYICLFAMPQQNVRDFAAPGLPTTVKFHADRLGEFDFRGDELCGLPHTEKTRGRFIVEAPAAFQEWVHEQSKKATR